MSFNIIEKHYRKNQTKYLKIAYGRAGKDYHLAEECVQEAYTRAIKYFHCFDGRNFDAWFNPILNNAINDIMNIERNRGLSLNNISDEDESIENISGSKIFDTEIARNRIRVKVSEVKNPVHQQILILFFFKGLKIVDIAKIVDISSYTAAKKVVSRFKQELLETLL